VHVVLTLSNRETSRESTRETYPIDCFKVRPKNQTSKFKLPKSNSKSIQTIPNQKQQKHEQANVRTTHRKTNVHVETHQQIQRKHHAPHIQTFSQPAPNKRLTVCAQSFVGAIGESKEII
jgi:hypothetical protein